MAAVQKRRSSNRVKTQKAAKVKEAKGTGLFRLQVWARETVTVLFLGTGLFLLLSLVSYSYLQWNGTLDSPARNMMGPVGHVVSTLLVGALGWTAFGPVLALWGFAFFRQRNPEAQPALYGKGLVSLAAITLLVTLAGVAAFFGGRIWGGSIGSFVFSRFQHLFGNGGSIFILTLVLAITLAIVSQRCVSDVARGLRWSVVECTKLFAMRIPLMGVRTCLLAGEGTWAGARWIGSRTARVLFSSGPPVVPPPPPLPKPRLRRNVSPITEPDPEAVTEQIEPEVPLERTNPIIVKPKIADSSGKKIDRERTMVPLTTPSTAPSLFEGYRAPDLKLLTREASHDSGENDDELRNKAEQIEAKLRDFNIAGRVTQVHPGPVITLFEFEPAAGVKVGRIAALQDDLAMSLKASSIRIIAPIPKRGTVGIEVPNKSRQIVRLRDCLESEAFANAGSLLSVPLGKDTYGDAVVVDITTMPHLLMAGATGTGKSVSINALLLSLLYRAHPAELGLILIDPKVLELSIYDGIPHLRVPVVTDPRQAKAVLSWAVKEMDRRYRYMQRFGVRNIDGYNDLVTGKAEEDANPWSSNPLKRPESEEPESEASDDSENESDETRTVEPIGAEVLQPLPKLVIVIDELADLMLSVGREVEELITRLAQKARAAGIHLIVATQRPSVDVITGLIKANFPARLSFRVSSRIDSRTILDSMGAEKLLGKGDMLFMLPGAVPLKRVHGAFVSDGEVQKVVQMLKFQCAPQYDENIIAACDRALAEESSSNEGGGGEGEEGETFDPFYDKAVELVVEKGQASTSMIQRTFRIGYNRAARIIEMMEREGIVGKMDGVKPREILVPASPRSSVSG